MDEDERMAMKIDGFTGGQVGKCDKLVVGRVNLQESVLCAGGVRHMPFIIVRANISDAEQNKFVFFMRNCA